MGFLGPQYTRVWTGSNASDTGLLNALDQGGKVATDIEGLIGGGGLGDTGRDTINYGSDDAIAAHGLLADQSANSVQTGPQMTESMGGFTNPLYTANEQGLMPQSDGLIDSQSDGTAVGTALSAYLTGGASLAGTAAQTAASVASAASGGATGLTGVLGAGSGGLTAAVGEAVNSKVTDAIAGIGNKLVNPLDSLGDFSDTALGSALDAGADAVGGFMTDNITPALTGINKFLNEYTDAPTDGRTLSGRLQNFPSYLMKDAQKKLLSPLSRFNNLGKSLQSQEVGFGPSGDNREDEEFRLQQGQQQPQPNYWGN